MRKYTLVLLGMFICCIGMCQNFNLASFKSIKVEQSCPGELFRSTVQGTFFYDTSSLALEYLGTNLPSLSLTYKGNEVQPGSLIGRNMVSVEGIEVAGRLGDKDLLPYIVVEQHVSNLSWVDTIPVHRAYYQVGRSSTSFNISNSCTDTITLGLPFAGTQTDIRLFEEKNEAYEEILRRTYYCCLGNEVRLAKSSTGRYKLGMTGCYTSYHEIEFELR